MDSGFDGVVGHATPSLARAARRSRVPVVNVSVNSLVNSQVRKLPSVLPDCEAAGAMAARHLMGRGFRQFGFLGFKRNVFSQRQRDGFHAALGQQGRTCELTSEFTDTLTTGTRARRAALASDGVA